MKNVPNLDGPVEGPNAAGVDAYSNETQLATGTTPSKGNDTGAHGESFNAGSAAPGGKNRKSNG